MSEAFEELLDPAFLARLERLELHVRRLNAGERRGDIATRRRGAGTLFREHRDYVPGDDVRSIDWNAYLRFDTLLVKEFDAEENPRLLLLVDRSGSMGLDSGAKLRTALSIAAALGVIGLGRHGAVATALFPLTQAPELFHGRRAVPRFLRSLAGVEAAGETRLLPAFQAACPPGRPSGIAVVLSDFYESKESPAALRFLRHRGFEVHAVHIGDLRDLEVRAGDLVELVDAETGRRVRERLDEDLASAYVDLLRQHFHAVEQVCRDLEVRYVRVDVREALERSVLAVLGRTTPRG